MSVRGLRFALPEEHGGNEVGIGMTAPAKIADNGINVERRAVLRDRRAIAVIFKEEPACAPEGSGHSGTPRIQCPNAVNETISSGMGVAADDDIGVAPGKQQPKLLVGDARLPSRPAWSRTPRVQPMPAAIAP